MSAFDAPQVSYFQILANHAQWIPEKEAVICGNRRLNWGAFNREINRFANGLIRLGIDKGIRFAY